jgi:hypothetical protein
MQALFLNRAIDLAKNRPLLMEASGALLEDGDRPKKTPPSWGQENHNDKPGERDQVHDAWP